MGNVQAVALQLYQKYLLPFEIASLVLLVAMIGAEVLARKELSGEENLHSGSMKLRDENAKV